MTASRNTLTRQTLLPLGLVASIVIGVASAAIWLNGRLLSIEYVQQSMAHDLSAIARRQEEDMTWSGFAVWIKLLKAQNPELSVPDVR